MASAFPGEPKFSASGVIGHPKSSLSAAVQRLESNPT
jgi:hypothetical protein